MLEKDSSVSTHKQNLNFLACDMFKLNSGIATKLIKELILPDRQHRYELQKTPAFAVQVVESVYKDPKSLSYYVQKFGNYCLLR